MDRQNEEGHLVVRVARKPFHVISSIVSTECCVLPL